MVLSINLESTGQTSCNKNLVHTQEYFSCLITYFYILGSGETLNNPCDKWFCSAEKMAGGTQVKSFLLYDSLYFLLCSYLLVFEYPEGSPKKTVYFETSF